MCATHKKRLTSQNELLIKCSRKRGWRWAVAPVEFYSTPKRRATQFIVVNLIHCRLSPTQPFSKRLPT
ncbi:MAG: hypothetical protein LBK82_01030 [Planctomycetaceae bacterium]|nr:hypothetical protein [Planctomycetaceae bacterium]